MNVKRVISSFLIISTGILKNHLKIDSHAVQVWLATVALLTHTLTSLVLHSVLLCQSDLLLYLPLQILRLLVQHLLSIAQLLNGHLR